MIFGREPALWLALVQAAIALLLGFGVHLTVEQSALIMAFCAAVCGLLVRQSVTPNAKLTSNGINASTLKAVAVGIVGAALLCGVSGAKAATEPPATEPFTADSTMSVLDMRRAAVGVDFGGVQYADTLGAQQTGLRLAPWLSYSLTHTFSLVAKEGVDLRWGRWRTTLGARACLYGYEPADRFAVYLALDRVWNAGNRTPLLPGRVGWATGVNAAWVIAKSKDGQRDLVYAKPQVAYDTVNGWDLFIGAGLNAWGGK